MESFCTHVAYLNQGKLSFAEEITSLTQRFREVTVVFEGEGSGGQRLAKPPASWLLPESSPAMLRFVHSEAVRESLEQQIATLLPSVRRLEAEPMTLRDIFVALARSSESQSIHATGSRP